MLKKIFCVIAVIVVICITVVSPFASDNVGASGTYNNYFYMRYPMSIDLIAKDISIGDFFNINIRDVGSTYGSRSQHFAWTYKSLAAGSFVSQYGLSGNKGNYADVVFPYQLNLNEIKFKFENIVFDPSSQQPYIIIASSQETLLNLSESPQLVSGTVTAIGRGENGAISFHDIEFNFGTNLGWQAPFEGGDFYGLTRSFAKLYPFKDLKDHLDNIDTPFDVNIYDYYIIKELTVSFLTSSTISSDGHNYIRYYCPRNSFDYNAELRDNITERIIADNINDDLEISFTDWIVTAVGGFFNFELIPGINMGAMLAFCIGIGLFIMFLKVFAGG